MYVYVPMLCQRLKPQIIFAGMKQNSTHSLPSPLFLLLKVILSVAWICIGLRFYIIVIPAYRMSALVSVPVACDTRNYIQYLRGYADI